MLEPWRKSSVARDEATQRFVARDSGCAEGETL